MKNPFVKECAWLDHLFLLLSSCWRRNVKWCLYLCSSGSREQVWVLMWVKNGPRCKSFHIPSHGRNNWSLTVLGSSRNTLNLKLEAFVPQLIIIYIFSRGIKKNHLVDKNKEKKTIQAANLLSLSHTRLVFTTDSEAVCPEQPGRFPHLAEKYGFLVLHHHLGLNQFHQSRSLSCRPEWKQAGIPALTAAAGHPAPILTWYNLPAWGSPEGAASCVTHFI